MCLFFHHCQAKAYTKFNPDFVIVLEIDLQYLNSITVQIYIFLYKQDIYTRQLYE